jgi:hypothetical protein
MRLFTTRTCRTVHKVGGHGGWQSQSRASDQSGAHVLGPSPGTVHGRSNPVRSPNSDGTSKHKSNHHGRQVSRQYRVRARARPPTTYRTPHWSLTARIVTTRARQRERLGRPGCPSIRRSIASIGRLALPAPSDLPSPDEPSHPGAGGIIASLLHLIHCLVPDSNPCSIQSKVHILL